MSITLSESQTADDVSAFYDKMENVMGYSCLKVDGDGESERERERTRKKLPSRGGLIGGGGKQLTQGNNTEPEADLMKFFIYIQEARNYSKYHADLAMS